MLKETKPQYIHLKNKINMEKKTVLFIDNSLDNLMQQESFMDDAINRVRRDSQLECANELIRKVCDAMNDMPMMFIKKPTHFKTTHEIAAALGEYMGKYKINH